MCCNKETKTTYLYSEEECKSFDNILKRFHDENKALKPNDFNSKVEKDILALLKKYDFITDTNPGLMPGNISYSLSSPGAEFYRYGGFNGERQKNIQALKDKKLDTRLKIYALFVGGLGGAIFTLVCKFIFKIWFK